MFFELAWEDYDYWEVKPYEQESRLFSRRDDMFGYGVFGSIVLYQVNPFPVWRH